MRHSSKAKFYYLAPATIALLGIVMLLVMYAAYSDPRMEDHPVILGITLGIGVLGSARMIQSVFMLSKDIKQHIKLVEKIEKEFL